MLEYRGPWLLGALVPLAGFAHAPTSVPVPRHPPSLGASADLAGADGPRATGVLTAADWSGLRAARARLAPDLAASAPIAQQSYLKASNDPAQVGASDLFGTAVAVSGDTVVVGAPYEDSSATGVNGSQFDNGASDAGAAYVFVRSGSTWILQAFLKASNTGASDAFGCSVAIAGDTIVVGAHGEDSSATGVGGAQADNGAPGAGAAYVFVRTGSTWAQQAYLKASNTDGGDEFGRVVSLSGDTIVVGAGGEDSSATGVNGDASDDSTPNAGAAYVFVRSGTAWTPQAYLKASNTDLGDRFGESLALDGDTLVCAAWGEDSGSTGVDGVQNDESAPTSGAAYVFFRSGTAWSQQAYLKASNTDAADRFGMGWEMDETSPAVAVSGDTIVVGASLEASAATGVGGDQSDDSANAAGAAYVFVRTGATWAQQAYLKASNTDANDQFGFSVAVSSGTVVVGALTESSSAYGIDGDQSDDSASGAGAAYVFVRTGTVWSQQAYLKASNTEAQDGFGFAVAASGDTVVVGAWREDSGTSDSQSSNERSSSGAVYVFGGAPVPVELLSFEIV